jgi:two-component system cell cycle response regulator
MLAPFSSVSCAISGQTGLNLARKSAPDLVPWEADMPALNGLVVCRAFKSDPPLAGVPIIVLSSHDSVELRVLGLKLGAVDFITKPVAAADITRVRTRIPAARSQRA